MENLTLDFNNFSSRVGLGTYEKCDSLTLTIVLDEKDYSGYKFKIVAKKSDGHIIEQDIKEQDINREERIIKTELNNQFTTKEGVVKLEINMIKDGKEDTTKEAFFIVRDTINGEVVESTSIIPTLEGVKAFIDEAVISLGDLEQAGEDIALINGEFKENEIKRKANELLRERSEKERVRLESIRTTEEADRIKAEAARNEAENNRKVAESNRKLAENTRKTNEAARVEAELNRQSLFEENEEIRNENENLRIEAEKERKLAFSNNNKFESERVEAEKLRAIAEDKRVTAEKARANAEEERIKAETRRENTYTDFNDSEVERKNNEANRVRAEAERVNAENGRNELFNTNEEKRNSTFIESERTRERAFNEAQSNRNEAYEESERVREEAFKVSEVARNEAEEGRVAVELLRVEAEKLRVAGEENRNTTFTQSEEERKGVFEEAENARKVAESKRVAAETGRVEAEKLRVTAETERVEAENLRVISEEERVAAETKREEGFNKFEGKINANTKELKNARTATTGEVFDTLDERIDCEVDRLNKKIDVTMLQQEDKGSHIIENSVEGMTTDMIIKGRTLNNLIVDGHTQKEIGVSTTSKAQYSYIFRLKENTKYTVIWEIEDKNDDIPYYIEISNFENKGQIKSTSKNKGIGIINTTTGSLSKLTCYYISSQVGGGRIKNVMVLEGDWTNKPIPNYFEGIKSFGQEENKISILSHGKNLIDGIFYNKDGIVKTDKDGLIKFENNIYTLKKENDGVWIYIPNGIYNFTGILSTKGSYKKIEIYKTNIKDGKKYSGWNVVKIETFENDVKKEFIIERTDCNYIVINLPAQMSEDDLTIKNFQLTEGTQTTPYEPYISNKKDILIKEPLRSVGDVYDVMYEYDNKIMAEKNIGKIKIDGRVDPVIFSQFSTNTHIAFYISVEGENNYGLPVYPDKAFAFKGNGDTVLCDKFKISNDTVLSDISDEAVCLVNASPNYVGFKILKSKIKTGDITYNDIKEYLKENPVTVYYQKAEPTIEIVENCVDINLKTFGEKTYVSFENSINGTSSFKAPVDTTATITRLNRENRALEEENTKLKAETYKNSEDIIITNEELQITQSAVDHLLFSNLNASGTAMLYNGKKKGGGSMGAYLAMRIIKGKLKYRAVMKQYGEFKEDIDLILEAEGYGHLITQQ